MRSDIVPGALLPDYELTDHTGKRRKLSELQGPDPMILVLSRGSFCPKDRRQAEGLIQLHREMEVGYCRMVTISTDNLLETNEYRRVDAHWPFLSVRAHRQGSGYRYTGPRGQSGDSTYDRPGAGPGHIQDLQQLPVLGSRRWKNSAGLEGLYLGVPSGLGHHESEMKAAGKGREGSLLSVWQDTRKFSRGAGSSRLP
jgi:hypothetical protein